MISFGFDKRVQETKKLDHTITSEPLTFIRNFEANVGGSLKRKSDESIKVSKGKLRVLDFKNFKDDEEIYNISSEEVAKLSIPSCQFFDFNDEMKIKRLFKKGPTKKRYDNFGKKLKGRTMFTIDDYCEVVGGKYKSNFGQIKYISEDGECIRVYFPDKSCAMIQYFYLAKITEEKYKDHTRNDESVISENKLTIQKESLEKESKESRKKLKKEKKHKHKEKKHSAKKEKLDSENTKEYKQEANRRPTDIKRESLPPIVERPLTDWLSTGLIVRISSEEFMDGKYEGAVVVIEDVYEADECSCVTATGQQLSGLGSQMLVPTTPTVDGQARIISGPHKGSLVTVFELCGSTAEVGLPYSDDNITVNVACLCQCQS